MTELIVVDLNTIAGDSSLQKTATVLDLSFDSNSNIMYKGTNNTTGFYSNGQRIQLCVNGTPVGDSVVIGRFLHYYKNLTTGAIAFGYTDNSTDNLNLRYMIDSCKDINGQSGYMYSNCLVFVCDLQAGTVVLGCPGIAQYSINDYMELLPFSGFNSDENNVFIADNCYRNVLYPQSIPMNTKYKFTLNNNNYIMMDRGGSTSNAAPSPIFKL